MQIDQIINGDSIDLLRTFPSESVHLILSDIPYGIGAEDWDVLHNNTNSAYRGSSPAQKDAGRIFKARGKPLNGWSEADRQIPLEYYKWCNTWSHEWLRILKPGGSAIIFAGRRLGHRCICSLEDAGFTYKDMLAWMRSRAPHRAQRLSVVFEKRGDALSELNWKGWRIGNLRPIFEPVLWFTKPYKIGATLADNVKIHGVGAYNEKAFLRYMPRPDNVVNGDFAAGEGGRHPTQKPIALMQGLIELVTLPEQIVLDPFCGSGSSLIAARNCGRHFMGIETDPVYCEIAQRELENDLFSNGINGKSRAVASR